MPSLARQVIESSALLMSRTLFVRVIGVIITVILVRSLSKFDYGLYALFMSAVGIASIFLMGNLGNVIVADAARELKEGKRERAKTLLLRYSQFIMLASIFISLALFLLSIPISWMYGDKISRLVVIIAFIMPLYALNNILTTIFHTHSRFNYMALISIVEAIGRLLFVVIAVMIFNYGLMGAIYSQLFGSLLSFLVALYPALSTVKYLKDTAIVRIGLFSSMLRGHGKFIIAMRPLYQLREFGLPWIIQFFLGVEAVAVFTVAKRGLDFFDALLFSISQVYLPFLSSEIHKGVERVNLIIRRSIKYLGVFSLIIVCGGIIIAPFLFEILFGVEYRKSVPIFRLILPILLVISFQSILNPVFMAYRGQKYLFYILLISLFAIMTIVSLLTPIAGLFGTGLGYLVGMFVQLILLYYYLRHINPELKIRLSSLFTIDDYDRFVWKKMYKIFRK